MQAYHEAREKGTDFLGKAEWKGRASQQGGQGQAEDLADSARDAVRDTTQNVRDSARGAWGRSKKEGESLVDSAKARGRRGWEETKEQWDHLKDSVPPGRCTHGDCICLIVI